MHLLLSRGYVQITKVMLLSPEACRLWVYPSAQCAATNRHATQHSSAAVAHLAPHHGYHSSPAEPGQKRKLTQQCALLMQLHFLWYGSYFR